MYDDPFLFVIVLIAKPPALVTDDESTNFVIECCHPVTNFVLVTSESSLINTFLVVLGATGHQLLQRPQMLADPHSAPANSAARTTV
jgi:hypothetical protein